jgi:hypothetical protein
MGEPVVADREEALSLDRLLGDHTGRRVEVDGAYHLLGGPEVGAWRIPFELTGQARPKIGGAVVRGLVGVDTSLHVSSANLPRV